MKICIDNYPFLVDPKTGPYIFLRRLSNCINNNFKGISISSRYSPFYEIGIFSTTNKSLYKKPYILRLDGLFIDALNTKYNSKQRNKEILESAKLSSGLIFVSEYCKNIYEKLFGKLSLPFQIINNGVPLEQFEKKDENLRKKLNIDDNQFVIISSASWRRHKRLEETLKFFKILKKELNNLVLIILGKIDEKVEIIKDKDIIYAGQVKDKDLSKWYNTANLYLHLAWIEPNSNSQAEAIASNLPSLCANNGGNHELVTKADGGIVSKCDSFVEYGLIDYYNPPEPNYEILKKDFFNIFNNYNFFQNKIVRKNIDIRNTSKDYIKFCNKIFFKNA